MTIGDVVKNFKRVLLAVVSAAMVVFIVFVFRQAHPNGPDLESDVGGLIIALGILMSVDFLVGLVNAIFFKESKKSKHGGLSSNAGTKGLIKKALVLVLVFSLHVLEKKTPALHDFPYIFSTTVIGFMFMELISIIENLILMGLPFPKRFKDFFEVIRKKEDLDKGESIQEKKEKEDTDNELD